jgi:TRAP-type mannitol/chloroaromatic compound transport system permease small subunit
MEELQWHLYALGWMIGLAYALKLDGHVRVDVLADRLAPRTRAWIELFGLLLLVLPLCYIMLTYGWPFVQRSWQLNEVSAAPGGLPARWIIKSVILLAFGLARARGAFAAPARHRLPLRTAAASTCLRRRGRR